MPANVTQVPPSAQSKPASEHTAVKTNAPVQKAVPQATPVKGTAAPKTAEPAKTTVKSVEARSDKKEATVKQSAVKPQVQTAVKTEAIKTQADKASVVPTPATAVSPAEVSGVAVREERAPVKTQAEAPSINAEGVTVEQVRRQSLWSVCLSRVKVLWSSLGVGQRRYLCMVGLPSLLCFAYFAVWASPMYISEVKFAVKSAEGGASGLNLMTSLFKVPTASLQDAMVVEEFLKSNDAFTAVDKELQLVTHFSSSEHDLISRLGARPTVDDIATFWSRISRVSVNQDSNVITFEVRAYTPDMAYAINEQILKVSEALVNSMNERAKEDMLELADIEVASARSRLTAAQDALRDFRNQHQDLDLKATAEGMQSLVIELESQAAMLRTEIAEQSRYTDPSAPAIQALKARLDGVMQQIERERSRLTEVPSDGVSINTLASQYENLVTEADFARQQLVFAMTSLENAKADILSKNLYIVTVAKPSLPDESLYPQPFLFTFYVFVALSMAYAVLSLIVAAIREHMGY